MQIINESYKVFIDPVKKIEHDEWLRNKELKEADAKVVQDKRESKEQRQETENCQQYNQKTLSGRPLKDNSFKNIYTSWTKKIQFWKMWNALYVICFWFFSVPRIRNMLELQYVIKAFRHHPQRQRHQQQFLLLPNLP
ncbi:MAG: hypothetical protein WCI23_12645 [Chlorobiaceae bacterium]